MSTKPKKTELPEDKIASLDMASVNEGHYTPQFTMNVHQFGNGYEVLYKRPDSEGFSILAFIGVFNDSTGQLRERRPVEGRTGIAKIPVTPEPTDSVRFYVHVTASPGRGLYLPVMIWQK